MQALNINFEKEILNLTFELTNSIGEVILTQDLNNKQNKIYTEYLTNGIYLFKINKNGVNIKNGKIIKN